MPRPLRALCRRFAPWPLALALGCSGPLGEAEIQGSLRVDPCRDGEPRAWTCAEGVADCAAFDLPADHLSLETFGARAVVRLQVGGRPLAQADAVVFDLREVQAVRARLGEPILLSDAGPVRGTLALFRRCPDLDASLYLEGSVTFEALGTEVGDRVAGQFSDLAVRDRRHPEAPPLGRISGRFTFDVLKGTIHQRFVDL